MNSITRKLVLSVLTVVLTVIALGTTTFAWFTLTNTSIIQPFEAQVVSDTGIEVAVGAVNADPLTLSWQTTITTQDIYDYVELAYPAGFEFTHVTTVDGVNFVDMNGVGVGEGYLEIPLHFRSDNEQQIQWEQVSLTSTAANYRTGVTFTDSQGVERLANSLFPTNLQDAMKISVTGITDRALATSTTIGYENAAGGTNTYSGGLVNADLRGTTEVVDLVTKYIGVNGAQNFYYRTTDTLPTMSNSVTTFGTQTSLDNELVLEMASGQEATADAVYYGYVMVRVWFEGWDAEAYNGLLGRIITISLQFGV